MMKNIVLNGIFYPEEAKSVGVCDYIVGKDCTIDEII